MAATLSLLPAGDAGSWSQRLAGSARYANCAMAAIALLGLVGWTLHLPLLVTFGGDIPILPSEAAMLLAGAVALAALHGAGPQRARDGVRAMAAFIALVCTFGLLPRMGVGVDVGLLYLGDPPTVRAPPASAYAYLLFALALARAPHDDDVQARLLAVAVAAVSMVALTSVGLRAWWPELTVPALDLAPGVALGLFTGSLSLLALRPAPRLVHSLQRLGAAHFILGRVLPGTLALLVVVACIQGILKPAAHFGPAGADLATIAGIVTSTALVLWAAERVDGWLAEWFAQRSRAEVRIPTEGEWLAATLSSIDDAVITADRQGRVGLANPAAEALLGIPAGSAVGRPIAELVQLDDEATGETVECPLVQALASGQPVAPGAELCLRRADGTRHAVEASALPIRAAEGALAGGVLVLREVGARRAREQALRKAYAELDRRVEERTQALERANEALSESAAMMETFAANTPELIIAKDIAGRITMINPAALKALGLTREQAVGRSKMELYGESEETRHIYECDHQVIETGQAVTVEEHLTTPRGLRTFLVTKSALRDEHGRVFGLVGVATDITERKQAQQELEQLLVDEHRLRSEAERANRAKDEFLAIVSHELRSPLNALKGWSHVLTGSESPDPVVLHRAMQAIKRNVEQQARLIDDLLDTSRIVSGKLTLEQRPIDLGEVVVSAVDQSRPVALAKKIELRFSPEPGPFTVDGDPGRLQQAIINLLSNAIKFTADEGVIDIGLRRKGEQIELSVSDNGIGIEADFLPHVFERFSQADSSTTRRYWGLGIGLALVRHLVELHGGTVSAVSPGAGRGSTFTVELPAAKYAIATIPSPAGEGQFHASEVLRGLRVLVVDDDADARDFLQFALERAGAEVRSFDSGRALRQVLAAEPMPEAPTVLVLDVAMPGEDGFSVLAQVRKMSQVPFMPAIAVTALTYLNRSHLELAGFQDYVGKPLDPQRLIKAIAMVAGAGVEEGAPRRLAVS
jgi:PAS domain S-box-containing protein